MFSFITKKIYLHIFKQRNIFIAYNFRLGQKTYIQEVVGLNPTVYWMDVSYISYYKSNEKKKKNKWGTQKNYLKKLFITLRRKAWSSG